MQSNRPSGHCFSPLESHSDPEPVTPIALIRLPPHWSKKYGDIPCIFYSPPLILPDHCTRNAL